MKHRPWPIVILAFLQIFCEPWYNFLLSAYWSHQTPSAYLQSQIQAGKWVGLFYILVLPPIMGLATYAMKKWSYFIFAAAALWMLFKNLDVAQTGSVSPAIFVTYYIGNLLFVGYFMLPPVAKPYLNKHLRWWETKPRYIVDFSGRITASGFEEIVRIKDFAVGGVFLSSARALDMGAVYDLRFGTDADELIAVKARPIFTKSDAEGSAPEAYGYGMQFVDLRPEARSRIASLARRLRRSKTPTRTRATSSKEDFKRWSFELIRTGRGLIPQTKARPQVADQPRSAHRRASGD